jgi:hypothetical protein
VFALPLTLAMIGVNLPATTFIGDMCPALESYVKNQTSDSAVDEAWVNYYLDCEGPAPLADVADYIFNQTALVKVSLEIASFVTSWH